MFTARQFLRGRRCTGIASLQRKMASLDLSFKSSIEKALECVVCLQVMRGVQVFMCSNGHAVCGHCSAQLQNCPVCRSDRMDNRCRVLEEIGAIVPPSGSSSQCSARDTAQARRDRRREPLIYGCSPPRIADAYRRPSRVCRHAEARPRRGGTDARLYHCFEREELPRQPRMVPVFQPPVADPAQHCPLDSSIFWVTVIIALVVLVFSLVLECRID